MVIREFFKTRSDGVNLYRNYSDSNFYIKQQPTEILYMEAVDVENALYIYEETDIPITDNTELTIEDVVELLSEVTKEVEDDE